MNYIKDTCKNVIYNKEFSLRDILQKIDARYISGDLSLEDKVDLEYLARKYAKPENDYASVEERLEEAFRIIEELESKVKAFEGTETEPSEGTNEPSEEVVEEYPPFKQPLGAHDSYKKGDKVTFNGKRYVSLINGNNWSPSVYPAGWKEVKEVA